ncbi:lipopolysaccharide transport periplasmic protein LptA [Phaeovulum sp. W22_SRMD_FR3]|uniref:lipopolysaccharide transport periplasmic protein LptA n=1 Tax=Phaeovulum sp. W22_SRMD_FR3 TaxID=3240274 RepID=UPI003F97A13B
MRRFLTLSLLCLALAPLAAGAQQIAFGGMRADAKAPVEVNADQLTVSQADGSAVFTGDVVIVQGEMKISAATVKVIYAPEADGGQKKIDRLEASGGVTLVNATDAAEAQEAVYSVDSGEVVMTGNVLLTQGGNTLTGQKLVVDLNTGTGQMVGRVRTTLQPAGGN